MTSDQYRRRYRSHPADVTADRLLAHSVRYGAMMTGQEQDALSRTIYALRDIAEGLRARDEAGTWCVPGAGGWHRGTERDDDEEN